jgi:hypothetical protein
VRLAGAYGRENVGMSSDKACENHARRRPKVSYARSVHVGLVGPKPRPRGVGDGQLVIIPAPPIYYGQWGDTGR